MISAFPSSLNSTPTSKVPASRIAVDFFKCRANTSAPTFGPTHPKDSSRSLSYSAAHTSHLCSSSSLFRDAHIHCTLFSSVTRTSLLTQRHVDSFLSESLAADGRTCPRSRMPGGKCSLHVNHTLAQANPVVNLFSADPSLHHGDRIHNDRMGFERCQQRQQSEVGHDNGNTAYLLYSQQHR